MVHRPSALKPDPTRSSGLGSWKILIAVGTVQLAFLGWFLAEPLPNVQNAGGKGLSRGYLTLHALPHVVPDVQFRQSYLGKAFRELAHVENLPQRRPIVLAALLIGASAVSLGNLALRGLKLRGPLGVGERIAVGYGLGATGLGVLTLLLGRSGLIQPWAIRIGLMAPILAEAVAMARGRRSTAKPEIRASTNLKAIAGFAIVIGPFLLIMALGAMLPTVDFDAIEYHLQGPKEYYQGGRIAFLPHNVYTSMPFGVEMLHLLGMEVVDDWWFGALAGQLLIAGFAPASAVLIASTASRLGSPRAGWVAAVVYLTAPWVYRLAVLPYVEGPLCFYHAALVWAATRAWPAEVPAWRPSMLVGLLAGGAMATKYPALISAVVPFGAWAVRESWRSRGWKVGAAYALGVGLVMAPWLAKNVVDTGNPVYPLAYKVFGGRHWDPARDAKWSAAHGPRPIEAGAFVRSIVDVAGRSDWQSPLFATLAPLALLARKPRRETWWIAGLCAYLFLTWWTLTHRLDRFWLPMLPPLAILAGLGADWTRSRAWTSWLAVVLAAGVATNAAYCSTALAGMNEWLADLSSLRERIPRMLNPALYAMDKGLPRGAKVLLVGQAAVFHLGRPIVYNTVFNEETIETIAGGRTPEQVGVELRRLGVGFVYVDWSEVDRYRSPGNYGFTPFVTPEIFDRLVDGGVLRPLALPGSPPGLYEVMPPR